MGLALLFISNPYLNILDDLVFIIIILMTLAHTIAYSPKLTLLAKVFMLVISLGIVVSLVSENESKSVLLSLRQYKHVFLFLFLPIVFAEAGDQIDTYVYKVLKVALYLSIPISIVQFISFDDIDAITGVFGRGGSGVLSLLIVIYICIEANKRISNNRSILGWYNVVLLPVLINETKITFILLPLMFVYLLLVHRKLSITKALSLLILVSIMLFCVDLLYEKIYQRSYLAFFALDELERYFFEYNPNSDIGRFQRIVIIYNYLATDSWFSLLFGKGLGASFHGAASNTQGIVASDLSILGVNEGSRIQLFHFIADFGLVGTSGLLIACLITIYKGSTGRVNEASTIACILLLVFLIGTLYQNILTSRVLSFLIFYYSYSYLIKKKWKQDGS